MASASGGDSEPIGVKLAVLVELENKQATSDILVHVLTCIHNELLHIQEEFAKDPKLARLHIAEVLLSDNEISLRFMLNDEDELINLYSCIDRLSLYLTKFLRETLSLDIHASVIMTMDQFREIKTVVAQHNVNPTQRHEQPPFTSATHREEETQPTRGNLTIIDESSTYEAMVKKSFYIQVPFAAKDVLHVRIKCKELPLLEQLYFTKHSHGIFSTSFELPVSRERHIRYCYEVKLRGVIYNHTKQSTTYILTDASQQRDMWDRTDEYGMLGIIFHTVDIIRMSKEQPLKTCVMELENFLDDVSVRYQVNECNRMLKSIIETLETMEPMLSPHLVVVVIGKLFHSKLHHVDAITQTQAGDLLQSLKTLRLDQFPKSVETYMSPVCATLIKLMTGKSVLLLRHMSYVYPFFDVDTLNRGIKKVNQREQKLCLDDEDSKQDAERLITSLFLNHMECHELPTNVQMLINSLLQFLPIVVSCTVYGAILNSNMSLRENTFSDPMYVRCVDELKRVKRDLPSMLRLWNELSSVTYSLNDIDALFEKEILETVKRGTSIYDDWETLLVQLLDAKGLFVNDEAQDDFLTAIAKSTTRKIHRQMKVVLGHEKYMSVPNDVLQRVLSEWLQTMMDTQLKSRKLSSAVQILYEYYFFAVRKSSGFEESVLLLDMHVVAFLKTFGLKTILNNLSCFEYVCTQSIDFEACIRHLLLLVKEMHPGLNSYEVIDSVFPSGAAAVNSRLTFAVLKQLIQIYFPISQTTVVNRFVCMVRKAHFWKKVFEVYGNYKEELHHDTLFNEGQQCIHQMIGLLETRCISFQDFLQVDNLPVSDVKTLLYCCKRDKQVVDRLLKDYKIVITSTRNNLKIVCDVLSDIRCRVTDNFLEKTECFIRKTQEIYESFDSMSPTEYLSHEGIWNAIDFLTQPCLRLKDLVKSTVFWNINRNSEGYDSCTEISEDEIQEDEIDCIQDVRYLFISYTDPASKHIYRFLEVGSKQYSDAWRKLEINAPIGMKDIRDMFTGIKSNMDKEIYIAETHLGYPLPLKCKSTLRQIDNIAKSKKFVDVISKSIKAFRLQLVDGQEFRGAVESFYRLLDVDNLTLTFDQASSCLQIVNDIEYRLSNGAILILESTAKASSLLEFLQSIAEDDIRNLIDAVEDISEQHVNENTVSALIDVQRFFKPLQQLPIESKSVSFFESVQKQVDIIGNAADDLPHKIEDCMNNLHNLKSLYNNVANRGEQTKEVIKNIIRKGQVHFLLCPEEKTCNFKVTYKQDKKQQTMTQTKNAIYDYRSRALLLMNTEKQKHETKHSKHDLEKFIFVVDFCNEISNVVYKLHICGHIDFKLFSKTIDLKQLEALNVELAYTLETWQNDVNKARREFYLMNFFQGKHLHALDNFFQRNDDVEVVNALVQFIHPKLHLENLRECYQALRHNNESFDQLQLIGMSFHKCFERLSPFSRQIALTENKTHITEIVQDGRLLVARLDEGSTQLVRCMLALFLKAAGALPEPYQILICSKETMWNEIELILGRCLGAYSFFGQKTLFCITNIELLSSEVQSKLIGELKCLQKAHFWLAVICQCNQHHHIVDEFSDNIVPVRSLSEEALKDIFHKECPSVFTYTSEVPGLGKTSEISKLAFRYGRTLKTLHISGPVHKRIIVDRLCNLQLQSNEVLHVNIGDVDSPTALDKMFFELIIMRFIDAGFLSVGLPTDFVAIEIGNTINDNLRDSLTTAVSFKRKHLAWNDYDDFTVSMEANSPVQVVCHYIKALDKGILDKQDLYFTGNNKEKPLPASECRQILRTCFNSTSDSSFSTVNTCLNVLADQLKKMSVSTFFRTACISDMVDSATLPTVRSTMVNGLIDIAKEFSSRSVSAYRSTQKQTVKETKDDEYNQDSRNNVHSNDLASAATKRIQGMIRWDDSNHLIFVFHSQNVHTVSPMYRDKSKVPGHIKQLFEGQMKRELPDLKLLDQQKLQDILQRVARKQQPLPTAKLKILSDHYALTPDNLLKMVLIMLRIKARIPIIIMGETGCGKTSLIRYLASICEIPFDVISVHAGVEENTLINRIHLNHEKAREDLSTERWVFFDEINTSEYIGLLSEVVCHQRCLGAYLSPNLVFMAACNPYKLRSKDAIFTSGLKSKVKTDELSRLVYRVHPLPEMLVDYVWDFGSLSVADEKLYIDRMMSGMLKTTRNQTLLVELLGMSQEFTRYISGTTSCVSLRDIQRCKVLLKWFLDVACKKPTKRKFTPYKDQEIIGIMLSLAHCYQSRYELNNERKLYRDKIATILCKHGINDLDSDGIHRMISQEQKDILARMELPPGTALNVALQENIFVLLVCILTRIPIFLVGKPGCSKSLSMQVIKSNLRGKDSVDDFFKQLPQLYVVSFQGSESSTSDGIIKVFEKAENYQKANKTDEVLSVVLLDEIGLAEVSRFNPLKVLHNLLEPEGLSRPNVAVVGISNWCLDESKMNRAVHLSRPEMDLEELHDTAISISESFESTEFTILDQDGTGYHFKAEDIRDDLLKVAKSYLTYIKNMKFENFHGLRDYYSLVKYFTRELSLTTTMLSKEEISEKLSIGVNRNFGGLPEEQDTLLQAFDVEYDPNITVLSLIKDNLCDTMARHLMLITTGESVTGILERELDAAGRSKREILFGSQFEEDLTDDYNYRILSRIILCMEQGMVLILKDLENIYGSLYDMLNKHYTEIGKKKLCRVALGAYSNPFCHVHENFKCIVLVDKKQIKYSDPPFLNRFEKHYLQFSDITSDLQKNVILSLEKWIQDLTSETDFQKELCFPIYGSDMLASLVLRMMTNIDIWEEQDLLEMCQRELLWIIQPEVIVRAMRSKTETRLLQSRLVESYLALPVHAGLSHFVEYQLDDCKHDERFDNGILTIVFTNSNVHTKSIRDITVRSHTIFNIGAFKSEKQFSLSMRHFWLESDEEIMFILCSIGNEKHIMLAKSVIERYRQEFLIKRHCKSKHAYFLIHVDRNTRDANIASAISYLSGWVLVMLDSIDRPSITVPEFCNMTLFESLMRKRPLHDHLRDKLLWTFTRIKYPKLGRSVDSFTILLETMKKSEQFIGFLEEQLFIWLKTNNADINATTWPQDVACDAQAMKTSMTFVDALEKYILTVVNIPLSKFIYRLEESNVLDCFFIEDHLTEKRKNIWEEMVSRKTILSICSLPNESGPESYVCDHHEIFLKLPFSMHIFKVIEETKDEFLQSVILLRGKLHLEEDDDLPYELVTLLLSQHESTVLQKIPDLADFMYSNEDYVHDYCNLISYTTCSSLDQNKRVRFMRSLLYETLDLSDKKPLSLVTNIHSYVWINYRSIYAVMQLLEFCFSDNGLDKETLENVEDVLLDNSMSLATTNDKDGGDNLLNTRLDKPQVNVSTASCEFDSIETRSTFRASDTLSDLVVKEESDYTNDVQMLTEDSHSLKSDYEHHLKQDLVEIICEKMLPLEEVVDIATWLRKAHMTLTFCSNVSLLPESLDELRFCYDLATRLIAPYGIEHRWLTKMTTLLHTHKLDSPATLNAFMEMVLEAPSKARVNGLTMLSKSLVGCLCRDPNTKAICMYLSWIMENKISDEYAWLFYAPVRLAIQLNLVEDPGMLYDLIKKDSDPSTFQRKLTSDKQKDQTSNNMEIKQSENPVGIGDDSENQHFDSEPLPTVADQREKIHNETDEPMQCKHCNKEIQTITCLDECLMYVVNTSKSCSFVTMVTDILLEIFNELDKEDQEDNDSEDDLDSKLPILLKSHKIIETGIGLRRAAAIAFTRYFMDSLGPNALDPDMHVAPKQALKSVFKSCPDHNTGAVIGNYFVKLLGSDLPVVQFCKKNLCWFKTNFSELQCEELTDDAFDNCFEYFPLTRFTRVSPSIVNEIFRVKEGESLSKKIEEFFFENASSVEGILTVFSVALKHFYILRPLRDTTDTQASHAKLFYEVAENKCTNEPTLKLLKCLLGQKDFGFDELMIDEGSGNEDCIISSWMASFYSYLTAHHTKHVGYPLPILIRCLMQPLSIATAYLPGFPDSKNECGQTVLNPNSTTEGSFVTCGCGHRLAFFKQDIAVCTVCQKHITCIPIQTCDSTDNVSHPGYTEATITYLRKRRELTPASHHILCLLIKGCLLGSVALHITSADDLAHITSTEGPNILHVLWEDIKGHWTVLSQLLNVDENSVSLILHASLFQSRDLFCVNNVQLTSTAERILWEKEFEQEVCAISACPFSAIQQMFANHYKNVPNGSRGELFLREVESVQTVSANTEEKALSQLFRLTGGANVLNLTQKVMECHDKYPFLRAVLEKESSLDLPKYMLPLIKWHIIVVSRASFLFKRQELISLSVEDFIRRCGNKDMQLKEGFKCFMEARNKIRKRFDELNIDPFLERVNFKTNLAETLVLDKDSIVYRVLEILIQVQNDFIDEALLLSKRSQAVGWYVKKDNYAAVIPQVELADLTKHHLIDLQLNWDDIFQQDSQCNLGYNLGRNIVYDLEGIERELAIKILVGKAYIGYKDSLPPLRFSDELYRNYVSLVNDVKEVVEQANLPHGLVSSIKTCHENDPKMASELLTYLGMVLTWLKKTKGNPDMALVDYIDRWQSIFTDSFPKHLLPSPQNCLLLGHIVAYHEYLEELSAESILESLTDEFRLELEVRWESSLKDHVKNDRKAADVMLKALKRFTYRCLSLRDAEPDTALLHHLRDVSFWPMDAIGSVGIKGVNGEIPIEQLISPGMTVGHIYWITVTIENEFETIRQNDLKISKLASSYHSQKKSTKPSADKQKKLLKRFQKRS